MKFEGNGVVISREAAINAVIEVCEKICDGTTTCGKEEVIKALKQINPIVFLCDRRACEKCSFPQCKHTFNIKHAKNFECSPNEIYIEKEHNK